MFDKDRYRRILYAGVFVMNVYCVLFLYSRAAYLSGLIGLLVMGLIRSRKVLILLLLVPVFWKTVLPVSVQDRITMTTQEDGKLDSSVEGRLALWAFGWDMFKSHPIFGVGYGRYNSMTRGIDRDGRARDPHNLYVKYLAEKGIIGFGVLLLFFYQCLRTGWRLYRDSRDGFLQGLGLGFFVCVICNMVGNIFGDRFTWINVMAYFWVFLGLCCVGLNLEAEEEAGNGESKDYDSLDSLSRPTYLAEEGNNIR
jgi:O-antigen ligase